MLLNLLFVIFTACAMADDSLTIINLQHRSAESLIPVLRSVFGKDATISGMNMKLFIRATPSTVADIRQLTFDLDGKPRMLRIAIRDNGQGSSKSSQLGLSGKISNHGSNARVLANETSSQQNNSGERFIMVEEGVPASLGDGSGNQVVARVTGNEVSVQLVPPVPGANGAPVTNAGSLNTTANAPAGQWVSLGGVQSSATGSKSGILNTANQASQNSSQLMLKVDPQ